MTAIFLHMIPTETYAHYNIDFIQEHQHPNCITKCRLYVMLYATHKPKL